MKNNKILLGITHGDINGIGYEVILKTLMDTRILDLCIPVIYGSPKVAAYHKKALNLGNISLNNIKNPEDANPKKSNIINCVDDAIRVELGKSTQAAGEASFIALDKAAGDLKEGKIDALITSPIDKENIHSDQFSFPGHTEFLKERFEAGEVLMLMVSKLMKIGVVTGHVPLAKVPEMINQESILSKMRILHQSLMEDFGIRKPRIAILGLNPHAGDKGIIGHEEDETISPAIKAAREEDIMAFGPYPADGFFGSGYFSKFDGTLAMYHDQGLAPFKAITFDEGVNYTAGLPVIRTSPAHGTAYEITGKNQASPESFRNALYLACDIFKNRKMKEYLESNKMSTYDLSDKA